MPIAACACQCGSVDNLIRSFLKSAGYQDWLSAPIARGKAKSRNMLLPLPKYPEVEMLDAFLQKSSKWAVIIGWNENGCRWADIAHNAAKSRIEAEFIVKTFS